MNQFNILNKRATRVSNCCFSPVSVMGDTTHFYLCEKCKTNCNTTTFFEELTEQLSNLLLGEKLPLDIVRADSGELILPANKKITKTLLRKVAANYNYLDINLSPIRNKVQQYIGLTCSNFNIKF